jgi:hypothetical protein
MNNEQPQVIVVNKNVSSSRSGCAGCLWIILIIFVLSFLFGACGLV